MTQPQLRAGDVAIALHLAYHGQQALTTIASATIRSIGEVHNALRRLTAARLLLPDSRNVVLEPLVAFIRWGVPYAFPPVVGAVTIGVPTARIVTIGESTAAPLGWTENAEFVWPTGNGSARGQALTPLYPNAPKLASGNPQLFGLLSMVDLIRVGGAREVAAAADAITATLAQRVHGGAE